MSELDAKFLQQAVEAGESATLLVYRMIAYLLLIGGDTFTPQAHKLAEMAEQLDALVRYVKEAEKQGANDAR